MSKKSPIKLAFLPESPLSTAEIQGWTEVLARFPENFKLTSQEDANAIILYGNASLPGNSIPSFRIPRQGLQNLSPTEFSTRISELFHPFHHQDNPKEIRPVKKSEKLWELPFDLPILTYGILQGWLERECLEDIHGRKSLDVNPLKKGKLLRQAPVDRLSQALADTIHKAIHPTPSSKKQRPWFFCSSMDIDSAGMFRGKATFRNLATILTLNPAKLPKAAAAAFFSQLSPISGDPHLRLQALAEKLEGMGVPTTFFCQTHRRHRLDSYTLLFEPQLKRQLRRILKNEFHEIGLHSSYATRDISRDFFGVQWRELALQLGPSIKPVHRAHYLRHPENLDYPWNRKKSPMTDSSLYYSQNPGFRRATTHPFITESGITEVCPAVMDVTLAKHMSLKPAEALEFSIPLMEQAISMGGAFVPLWHPNNMDEYLWPGWAAMYDEMIEEAKSKGARFLTISEYARQYRRRRRDIENFFIAHANQPQHPSNQEAFSSS